MKEQSIEQADRGCPCLYVKPCSDGCTCRYPHMSYGCRRCCRYGNLEQRTRMARYLAEALEHRRHHAPVNQTPPVGEKKE